MTDLVNQSDDHETDHDRQRRLGRVRGNGHQEGAAGDGVLHGPKAFEGIDEEDPDLLEKEQKQRFRLQRRDAEKQDQPGKDFRQRAAPARC